jgi:uncharacterized cupredoxin-like copper-binding protein
MPRATAHSRSRLARRSWTPLAAVALLALAGCGSSSSSTSSSASTPAGGSAPASSTPASTPMTTTPAASGGTPAAGPLSVSAGPGSELKFNPTSPSAKAGQVSIAFNNSTEVDHNLTIASSSGTSVGATPSFHGGTKTLSVSLQPGTYKFYRTVPGHRAAGMEGTITV